MRKKILTSLLAASLIAVNLFFNNAGSVVAEDVIQGRSMPGLVEGQGTLFQITESDYLNVTLASSQEINVHLESAGSMISVLINPVGGITDTTLTLSGLVPNTTYYKYTDTYEAHDTFVADQLGVYSFEQNVSEPHAIFIQTNPSTKIIKDDATGGNCTLIGLWDSATKTCTLNQNVNETIQIANDGITLDGNGFSVINTSVSGRYTGHAVYISGANATTGRRNITIKNLNTQYFQNGIYLRYVYNSSIINNNFQDAYYGIYSYYSNNNTISNNTIPSYVRTGIYFYYYSKDCQITNNQIGQGLVSTPNTTGIDLYYYSDNNVVTGNIVKNNALKGINVSGYSTTCPSGGGICYYPIRYNQIYGNKFIDNTAQAEVAIGENNSFNQPAPVGGNYWSNWLTPDINLDGFVDVPFIFTGGQDNLPLTGEEGQEDQIAPTTTIGLTGTAGSNGWYVSDVVVDLAATDNVGGSGVAKTEYSFDGSAWNLYSAPITVSTEGENVVYYKSTDVAGNIEIAKTENIKIDKTAPVITGAATTAPNANGWYNSDVAVHFDITDAISGVDGVASSDVIISTEGLDQSTEATAKDLAGNTATLTVGSISIDKTAPIIDEAFSEVPNENNWFNKDVSVYFMASDVLSGVDVETTEVTITTEGENQSATGEATDKAGNIATKKIEGINIDKTAPVITGAATTVPNANGWYNSDVTVRFAATDIGGSGVASVTPDTLISTEAKDQFVEGVAEDAAGNISIVTVNNINIDKTAPTIDSQFLEIPNANGWYNSDATVHFSATDEVSGIDTATSDIIVTTEGENQSATGEATDKAGNIATKKIEGINIDKTAPVITGAATTAPNANGWYNSDVTVQFASSDSVSGVASSSPDIVLNSEGVDQSVTGYAVDKAGNVASAVVGGLNIDNTAPVVTISAPIDSEVYTIGQSVLANWTAVDDVSGIASAIGTVASGAAIDTSVSGDKAFTVEVVDKAGNITNKSVSYSVQYDFERLLPLAKRKAFRFGSTIPVAFKLKDSAGNNISTASAKIYVAKQLTDGTYGVEIPGVPTTNIFTGNSFRYFGFGRAYAYLLNTKSLSIGAWRIRIALSDGSSQYINIELKSGCSILEQILERMETEISNKMLK